MDRNKEIQEKLATSNVFNEIHENYSEVHFSYVERTFSDAEGHIIDGAWGELIAKRPSLQNRPLLATFPEQTKVVGKQLQVTVYPARFKEYLATLDNPTCRVWAVGINAMICLEDDSRYYIFGERRSTTLGIGGSLETVGSGFVEPSDTLLEAQIKEIEEEAGIDRRYIKRITPLHVGLIREYPEAQRRYQDMCFDNLVYVQGITHTSISKSSEEHSKIIPIPEKGLLGFIESNFAKFTPRTRFTLGKFLRGQYG